MWLTFDKEDVSRRRAPRRFVLRSAICLTVAVSLGCASQPGRIFDPIDPPLVWPAPPKPERISYVGQLRDSSDLKPARKPFQALSDFFVGKERPEPLYGPRDVICTPDGLRVWVADPGGRCVHLFDLEKRDYRKITRAGDMPLLAPVSLGLGPEDSFFVCDSEAVAIYRLSAADGTLLEALRLPEDVNRPVAIRFVPQSDALFVVDVGAHNVKVLDLDGTIRRIIGRRGGAPGEFNFPTAITDDGEKLWVVDTGNNRVQGLSREGDPVLTIGQAGDAPGDFALPKGIAVDSDGQIYVVDARFENIQIFDRTGRLLLFFGEEGNAPGAFWLPSGIFIDARDRIWVCDSYNRRVQLFSYVKEVSP